MSLRWAEGRSDGAGQKLVGVWSRATAEHGARDESALTHRQCAEGLAASRGWHIVSRYEVRADSGRTVFHQAGARMMVADVASQRISGLIFSTLPCLAASQQELLELVALFQTHEADLIGIGDGIDTTTPAGRSFYRLVDALARLGPRPTRRKTGQGSGGAAPFGYRKQAGRLELDEREAPVRKLIFELFLEHRRLKTVARLLNGLGHRTRAGKPFSDSTVRRLLTDPLAKGQQRSNYTASTGVGKHWCLKPAEEWIFSDAPALVSVETWEQVRSLLATPRSTDQS